MKGILSNKIIPTPQKNSSNTNIEICRHLGPRCSSIEPMVLAGSSGVYLGRSAELLPFSHDCLESTTTYNNFEPTYLQHKCILLRGPLTGPYTRTETAKTNTLGDFGIPMSCRRPFRCFSYRCYSVLCEQILRLRTLGSINISS